MTFKASRIIFLCTAVILGMVLVITSPAAPNQTNAVHAAGTTYYVDVVNGSNSWSDSEAQNPATPWKTIRHAVANVPAGTAGNHNTIMVAAGIHTDTIETYPILFLNDYVDIIGAGISLPSPTVLDAESNSGEIFHFNSKGNLVQGFVFQRVTISSIKFTGGDFTVKNNRFRSPATAIRVEVNDSSHDGQTFTIGNMVVSNNDFSNVSLKGVDVESFISDSTGPGPATITIGNLTVSNNIFTLSGAGAEAFKSYFSFSDIENGQITAGDWSFEGNQISGGDYGINIYTETYFISGSSTVTVGDLMVKDNEISGMGSEAVSLSHFSHNISWSDTAAGAIGDVEVSGNTINQSTVAIHGHRLSLINMYDNVTITCGDTFIENNNISNAESFTASLAIHHRYYFNDIYEQVRVAMGDSTIQRNTISGGTRTAGIIIDTFFDTVSSTTSFTEGHITIQGNTVYDIVDQGIQYAIHVWHDEGMYIPGNMVIQNNVTDAATGLFISSDRGEPVHIYHNTFAHQPFSPDPGIHIVDQDAQIKNNIITGYNRGILASGATVTEDYNLFYQNTANVEGAIGGGHSFTDDPDFVDFPSGDFHLMPTSPAIDAGVDAGVTVDNDGVPRPLGAGFDIGAYEYERYDLEVTLIGSGEGTVTSSPSGIDCPGDCSETYNDGEVVQLTAVADTDSTFTGWGDACSGSGACQVTMTEARNVTATFTPDSFDISLPVILRP